MCKARRASHNGKPKLRFPVAPTPTCHKGLQWAFYQFAQGDAVGPGSVPYNTFNPTYNNVFDSIIFKGQTPAFTGVRGGVGGVTNCQVTPVIDGVTTSGNGEYIGIQQRGYWVPAAAGDYTLWSYGDDVNVAWLGPSARSGFTKDNATVVGTNQGGHAVVTITPAMVGTFIPFRIQFVNAESCYDYWFAITDSSGANVIDPNSDLSDQFVQYCDGTSVAPNWPDWNAE